MTEDAFSPEVIGGAEGLEQRGEIAARGDALASHAGIEFEVDGNAVVEGGCGPLDGPDVFRGPDDGGQIVFEEAGGVFRIEAAHDEDASPVAGETGVVEGVADADAFFEVCDAEPAGAGFDEGGGAEGGAVAVGVGFDHAEDLEIGAGGFLDGVEVAAEVGGGDFDPASQGGGWSPIDYRWEGLEVVAPEPCRRGTRGIRVWPVNKAGLSASVDMTMFV